MIVPIVRRTVTVTTSGVFDFPFQCDVCRLATWAHVAAQGTGADSMAYLSPNEEAARQRSWNDAKQRAWNMLAESPCPQCGSHSASVRASIQAWEQKAASRAKLRPTLLIAGLAMTLLWSGGCGVIVAAEGDQGSLGAGVILGFGWIFVGVIANLILYAILGPGARPNPPTRIPESIYFDPPAAAQPPAAPVW